MLLVAASKVGLKEQNDNERWLRFKLFTLLKIHFIEDSPVKVNLNKTNLNKALSTFGGIGLAIASVGFVAVAKADTVNARCSVYPKGEDRASWYGSCTFSQRQGYVGIQLQNGKRYDLSPTGQPNQFRDQNGRPAHREAGAGDQQIYRLSKESIYVSFDESSSGDALVPGTNYNATGNIPCSMGGGQPTTSCRFGVVRKGNGNGAVTVTKPDNRTRTIFFENGKATGYDQSQADSGKFSAQKQADLNIVYIGQERYEIPDAVIYGG